MEKQNKTRSITSLPPFIHHVAGISMANAAHKALKSRQHRHVPLCQTEWDGGETRGKWAPRSKCQLQEHGKQRSTQNDTGSVSQHWGCLGQLTWLPFHLGHLDFIYQVHAKSRKQKSLNSFQNLSFRYNLTSSTTATTKIKKIKISKKTGHVRKEKH